MRTTFLLSSFLAFGFSAPSAAQIRVAMPGAISIVPAFAPALAPGLAAAISASSPDLQFTPGLLAPSIGPALASLPALDSPLIPAAATPSLEPATNLLPSQGPFEGLSTLVGMAVGGATATGFDGTAESLALGDAPLRVDLPRPLGTKGVSVIRLNSAAEAKVFIPRTSSSEQFIKVLEAKWSDIGWLDFRVYLDSKGGTFRAIDISGRPELADYLPDIQPHEVALIRKIQLHSKDLQLVIREAGKTPDLIVDGVMIEMKSLFPNGEFQVQLANANAQVLAHAELHRLAPGGVAIDMTSRDYVPATEVWGFINDYVRTGAPIGLGSVWVYAGKERRIFTRRADGLFQLEGPDQTVKPSVSVVKTAARFLVPDLIGSAVTPDPELIVREVLEPTKRLRDAGVKATITVYGSARIMPPDVAIAEYDALIKRLGRRPKLPADLKKVKAARQAVAVSKYYEIARRFGRIVAENGGGDIAVVTGGGPGIMEAANRGAFEAGGPSVGYNIILDKEQGLNQYTTHAFEFEHFPTRKMAMRHGAMGLVYFPGGFGTMDELFEILTLMQTHKMPRVPIVLIGEKAYWDKILDFDEFAHLGLISDADLSLFRFADTAEGAWRAIIETPVAR